VVGTFEANVKQAQDYYPFGSLLYGRDVSAVDEDYHFLNIGNNLISK